MGKGDKKTKKGKISNGSYGVTRKKKDSAKIVVKPKPKKETAVKQEAPTEKAKPVAKKAAPVKKAPAKKTAAKK
jgi:ribosomal small subunit protein bTHX